LIITILRFLIKRISYDSDEMCRILDLRK